MAKFRTLNCTDQNLKKLFIAACSAKITLPSTFLTVQYDVERRNQFTMSITSQQDRKNGHFKAVFTKPTEELNIIETLIFP